ncbi:hypothetical protein OO17_17480 [Rhodopseudomonas palustris]|uniref:Solute-binding protein family 5 domain-containing protein n=2 Tax=Nitrobacteraceae TaxID=41294 RepID=A0A0D7EM21_RHOPL|nr:hypothetical protein OO17_17480 [Rhodopseudomonas palustris]
MDPQFHQLSTNMQVLLNIFEGLTNQDPLQKITPALATKWEAIDDTTWRFTLRDGVKFQNGSIFSARDVIYTYCRVPLVANSPSSYTIYTGTITDVTADGANAVLIKTAGANPLLPTDVANLPILSADAAGAEKTVTYKPGGGCEGMGKVPQSTDFNSPTVTVGTGPYKLESFVRGSQMVMTRYDGYWGPKPDWDKVTLRPITSDGPRVAALLSGDVDMIESPPIQDLKRIKNAGYNVVDALSNRIIYLAMDQDGDAPSITGTDGKNPLLDKKVREAISLAINRGAIVERIMGGYAKAAGELLPPPMFGTNGRAVDKYDPEKAKQLLTEAGYPKGFGITLGTPNDRYINDAQVAQAVAQMLARIGITTKVDAQTASQFFSRRNKLDFPMYLAGWSASSGEMSSPLKSLVATYNKEEGTGPTNAGRYSNPAMDKLLKTAMTTIDDAKREALLRDAEKMVLDDYGIIPLHYEQTVWAMKKGLSYAPRVDQYTIAAYVHAQK